MAGTGTDDAVAPVDQFVIRFGLMKTEDLQLAAETAFASGMGYSLSFWTMPDRSREELASWVARGIRRPGGSFRCTTLKKLTEAGYRLQDVGIDGHCRVVFDTIPSADQCAALRAVFDETLPNPYRQRP